MSARDVVRRWAPIAACAFSARTARICITVSVWITVLASGDVIVEASLCNSR